MIPNTSAGLIPSTDLRDAESKNRRFLETIVYPGNVDSPHTSLLSPDDILRTGGLFEQVELGLDLGDRVGIGSRPSGPSVTLSEPLPPPCKL